jgi:hypothetical protein
MTVQKTVIFLFSVTLFGLLGVKEVLAVRPLSANIALVAGEEGHPGFKDGSFTSALFNTPLGLAVSNDGNRLFVADSGNNRIRVIHLDQNNDVSTLAGQDLAGKLDGPLTIAQFNHPCGVLYLPSDRLVVNDFGNQLLRLVDLKTGTVTTLAGGGALPIGPATQISMNGVRDFVYMPAANSIFFTQPDLGSLKMLSLNTGLVSTVLNNNIQLPHPAALWCQENKLYLADRDLLQVFTIDWKNNTIANLVPMAAPLAKVLSLSLNSNILYALLQSPGVPAERFFLNNNDPSNTLYSGQFNNQLVSFKNPWGDTVPQEELFPLQDLSFSPSIGFVPDPSDGRKFYVSKPEYDMVISFRDLFGVDWDPSENFRNSNNIDDTEYPAKKPKNTYRILIIGDSRSVEIQNHPFPTDFNTQKRSDGYRQILTLSKQIERELNLQAALDGAPLNYEVSSVGRQGDLFLWPTYQLPDIVQHNDIDLVIIFMARAINDFLPYKFYFDSPITSDGIPKFPNDMEYLLKPPLERIPNGIPRNFYDFCKAHGLVSIEGNVFNFDWDKLSSYPELHESLVQLYGKPLAVLNRKLSVIKTSSGQPARLLLCNTFTGRSWTRNFDIPIWVDAAKKFNFSILDLNDEVNALHLSYFPLTGDNTHLNPDGHVFFARLIAHDLIRDKLIPWK